MGKENSKPVTEVAFELAQRFRRKRLAQNKTQKDVSLLSGVALGSLRRFERTGEISLISLIKLAGSISAIENLNHVFREKVRLSLVQDATPPRTRARKSTAKKTAARKRKGKKNMSKRSLSTLPIKKLRIVKKTV